MTDLSGDESDVTEGPEDSLAPAETEPAETAPPEVVAPDEGALETEAEAGDELAGDELAGDDTLAEVALLGDDDALLDDDDDDDGDDDVAVLDDDDAPRITEIGAPEIIDKELHPVAAAVGVAVLLLVVFAGVLGINRVFGGTEERREVAEVVVPRLSSRPVGEAQAELERLGLIVDVRFQPNEIVAPDVVVDQQPIAGARLEVGEQVILGVSDGPAGVRVPDLVGQTTNEATRLLSVLGLTPVVVAAYDESVQPGLVISTNPAAKGRGVIGSPVELKISQGPEPRTVPAVVGIASPEAMAQIGSADLTVGDITRRYVKGTPTGTVLSTAPAPGTKVARDLPIDVVIASGPTVQTVPDLVGLTRASAEKVAAEVGITLKVTTELVAAGDRRAGLVISQAPVADSPLAAMSVVVGVQPAPTTTTTVPGGVTTTAPAPTTTAKP